MLAEVLNAFENFRKRNKLLTNAAIEHSPEWIISLATTVQISPVASFFFTASSCEMFQPKNNYLTLKKYLP